VLPLMEYTVLQSMKEIYASWFEEYGGPSQYPVYPHQVEAKGFIDITALLMIIDSIL